MDHDKSKDVKQSIANNLRTILRDKNMTQKEFANAIGASMPAVSAWCNGHKAPHLSQLDKICSVLGVSREDIYKDSNALAEHDDTISVLNDLQFSLDDLYLAHKISNLDPYRRSLVMSIINTEPGK